MKVEVLYLAGCPNYKSLLEHLPTLLSGAGINAEVAPRNVAWADAAALRFLGSPTVRVDGRDVEPGSSERSDYGLKCRLYRTADGIRGQPPDEWILAAARNRVAERADPGG